MESQADNSDQSKQPCHTRQVVEQGFFEDPYLFTMLDSEEESLEELLDSTEMLVKLQMNTTKDFLSRPKIIEKLIDYCLTPFTEEDHAESRRLFNTVVSPQQLPEPYRYAFLATEVLSTDITQVIEAFSENQDLRTRLFQFVDVDHLNPWLALRLTEIIYKIMKLHPQKLIVFVHDQKTVKSLVKHIITSPIGDLLGNLLGGRIYDSTTQDLQLASKETINEHAQWWIDAGVFSEILSLIEQKATNPEYEGQEDEDASIAAFRFLSDLIRRYQTPTLVPYVKHLMSPEITKRILSLMLAAQKLSGNSVLFQEGALYIITLVSCLKPILIERLASGDAADEVLHDELKKCLKPLFDVLPEFRDILATPGPMDCMRMSWQLLKKVDDTPAAEPDPYFPLGAVRLKITEMMLALTQCGLDEAFGHLLSSGLISETLALFHKYECNSILHCTVNEIINTNNFNFITSLLLDFRLTDFILRCHEDNVECTSKGKPAKGYMGAITSIGELLVGIINRRSYRDELSPEQDAALTDIISTPQWEEYCTHLAEKLDNEMGKHWPDPRCRGEENSDEENEEEPEADNVAFSDNVPANTPGSKYSVSESAIMKYHASMLKEKSDDKSDGVTASDFYRKFFSFPREEFPRRSPREGEVKTIEVRTDEEWNLKEIMSDLEAQIPKYAYLPSNYFTAEEHKEMEAEHDTFSCLGTISESPETKTWNWLSETNPENDSDRIDQDISDKLQRYSDPAPSSKLESSPDQETDILTPDCLPVPLPVNVVEKDLPAPSDDGVDAKFNSFNFWRIDVDLEDCDG